MVLKYAEAIWLTRKVRERLAIAYPPHQTTSDQISSRLEDVHEIVKRGLQIPAQVTFDTPVTSIDALGSAFPIQTQWTSSWRVCF